MTKRATEAEQNLDGKSGEITGRYAIDQERRAATLLPATSPEAEEMSLDGLDAVIEEAKKPAISKPPTVPPPIPAHARSHVSGIAPARTEASTAEVEDDEALVDSLRPFYKQLEGKVERAEVDVADLTLSADNPYLASSLVPPSQSQPGKGRIAVGVVAALLLLGGGYLAFGRSAATSSERPAPSAKAAVEQAPAARVEAPSAAPAAEVPASAQLAPPVPAEVAAPAAETAAPAVEAAAPTAETAAPAQAQVPSAPVAKPATLTAPTPAPNQPAAEAPVAKPAAVVAAVAAPAAEQSDARMAVAGSAPAQPAAAVAPASAATPATAPEAAATPAAAATDAPVAAPAAPADLPETLTREQVSAGFDTLKPDLLTCAAGKTGIVVIDATIANSGRIAGALIDGKDFKGSPEGSCMARAVRKARFPQFTQPTIKVLYPVAL